MKNNPTITQPKPTDNPTEPMGYQTEPNVA